jgi:hypothetical protein
MYSHGSIAYETLTARIDLPREPFGDFPTMFTYDEWQIDATRLFS